MAGGRTTGPTSGSKYHGSSKSVPKDPSAGRGAPPPSCYPATIEFASDPSETNGLVEQGMKSRRPGGVRRGKGPWSTDPEGFSKTKGEFRSPAKLDPRSPSHQ